MLKKSLYLLNIDNYCPEITVLTYPTIYAWAKKVGADVYVLNERKFPTFPHVYEKLQIYEIEKERQSDWVLYVDSDCIIHHDMPDPTELLTPDTVLQHGHDFSWHRAGADDYMRRDGRWIGTCNWFTVFPKACLDLYQPLTDLTLEEAMARMKPTKSEADAGITSGHLIDDFVLTRNLARYGLKYITVAELFEKYKCSGNYLFHIYKVTNEEKVILLKQTLDSF